MPHSFGAMPMPVPIPNIGEAVSDRGLTLLVDYLRSCLTAYVGTAWASVAPSEPIVRVAHAYNPDNHGFSHRDLPALYAWRVQDKPDRSGDGRFIVISKIYVVWIYPPQMREKGPARDPIFNGVAKVMLAKIEADRDPCWVRPEDDEPYKVELGSCLSRLAGFDMVQILNVEETDAAIRMDEGSDASYPAIMATLEVQESMTFDPSVGRDPSSLHLKVTTSEPVEANALIFNQRIRP